MMDNASNASHASNNGANEINTTLVASTSTSMKLDDTDHAPSVKIECPRPKKDKVRVTKPTILQTIFRKKNVKNTQYYFTSGNTNGYPIRDVSKEVTPYFCPTEQQFETFKMLCRQQKQMEKQKTNTEKSTFLSRQSQDIRARCHVPDDSVGGKPVVTIMDLDPNYFSIIQNRPIKEKFSKSRYKDNLRECLRNQLEIGYYNDEILQNEEHMLKEQHKIDEVHLKLKRYGDYFEEFLGEDHHKARLELSTADRQIDVTNTLIAQRNNLMQDLGNIRYELYVLEDIWTELKTYQEFLYRVAPYSWRIEHDWIHRDADGALVQDEVNERSKTNLSDESNEEDDAYFDPLLEDIPDPKMPFKEPEELIRTLDDLADSTLYALAYLEQVAGPLADAKANANIAKKQVEIELNNMNVNIETLRSSIEWENQRSVSLKERMTQLLHGPLKDSVAIGPALTTQVWVEDCYECCVGKNDSNISAVGMAHGIEHEMNILCLELDSLPFNCVVAAEHQIKVEQEKVMATAKSAHSKVKLVDYLLKSIQRGLEKPKPYGRRRLKPRTAPPAPQKQKENPPRVVTEEELNLLHFFTEYCNNDDIDTYLDKCNFFKMTSLETSRAEYF